MRLLCFVGLTALLYIGAAHAQAAHEQPAHDTTAQKEQKDTPATLDRKNDISILPGDSTTSHAIQLNGQTLSYRATAGTLPLYGVKNEVTAKIYYTAYRVENTQHPRSVTFVFNGGPGAASAFLHLGAIGPRIVPFVQNGAAAAEPVKLADNSDSWLDFTDLVFVDPVGTGFSRASGTDDEAKKAFWGVEKDADSLTQFIKLYLAKMGRSLDPVYIAGESYGGFRVPLLAHRLLKDGIQVKGAVLISPALEFAMLQGDEFLLMPLATQLPSIVAVTSEKIEGLNGPLDRVHEAEKLIRGDYLLQLASGTKPNEDVVRKLAQLTNLDAKLINRHNGRVSASFYASEYERETNRTLSAYDATISTPLPRMTDGKRDSHFDPILDGAINALAPALVSYAKSELGFGTDLDYRLLNREVNGSWDYGTKPNRQGFAGSLDDLQQARIQNPKLKIMIAHGYTDFVTTYSASQFLVDQLEPIDGARPITMKVYRGGHMMYLRPASRHDLKVDVEALYRE